MQKAKSLGQSRDEMFATAVQIRKEDGDIHPRELSGDQNEEASILASYVNHSKANFFLTATIIIKTTVGAGIISLPYTISRLGYVMAPIVFIAFFCLNQFASVLLLKSKNLSQHSNYHSIMHYIWSNDGSRLFGSSLIFLDNLGTCILQFILIKSSVRKIAAEVSGDPTLIDQWYLSQYFIVLVIGLIEFPLVMIRKIERLRIFSFIGVAGIVVFVVGIVVLYVVRRGDGFPGADLNAFPDNWFQAISATANIVFAFQFQMNFFPIYKGMKDVTDKRMEMACLVGILGCAVPYLTVGFLGYSLTGSKTNANFLQSIVYAETSPIIFYIVNISYLFSIFFAIVLIFFSGRNNFINIVHIIRKRLNKKKEGDRLWQSSEVLGSKNSDDTFHSKSSRRERANKEYIICTIVLYVVILIGSIFLQNIGLIFNFLGAICESLIAVLLPCTFYVMLIRRQKQPKRFIYFLSVIIVAVMTPYAIFSVVSSYIDVD